MEKKSKAEKLKLRGINQTILISSYNSGAGTGPNDCMTEEVMWHWMDDTGRNYLR